MFFFFFLNFSLSELGPKDDPYQILGIPKNATAQEIKKAYRQLTLKLHPDISKTRSTEKEWIKVTEAYEILSDPDSKYRFDNAEYLSKEDIRINFMDDPHSYSNFDGFHVEVEKLSLREVTRYTFDDFTKQDGEYLFLVYTSLMCSYCNDMMHFFEVFKNEQSKHLRCAVIDTTVSADLAKSLGAQYLPSLIYIKITNGKKHISVIKKPIRDYKSIVDFYNSQFDIKLTKVSSISELQKFLQSDGNILHVIQLVRHSPTPHFIRT